MGIFIGTITEAIWRFFAPGKNPDWKKDAYEARAQAWRDWIKNY
jgi:hypothetical protein